MQARLGRQTPSGTQVLVILRAAVTGDNTNRLVEAVLKVVEEGNETKGNVVAGARRNTKESVNLPLGIWRIRAVRQAVVNASGLTSLSVSQLNPTVTAEKVAIPWLPLICNRGREEGQEE